MRQRNWSIVLSYWRSERHWSRLGTAGVLGSLAVLGFAPVSLPWITWLALLGLWLLWSSAAEPKQATQEGFAFGFGFFGYGISWLGISLAFYGGVPFGLAWLMVLVLVSLLALIIAALGRLAYWAYHNTSPWVWAMVIMPALWVLSEWLRTVVWSGFPWLLVGYTSLDTWLSAWAPVGGVLGVSWLIALLVGLLWLLVQQKQVKTTLIMLITIWATSAALVSHTWVEPTGDQEVLAVVHGQLAEDKRWQLDEILPSVRLYQRESEPMLGKVAAIIWPETAIPTFLDSVLPALTSFREQALAQHTQIITGTALREEGIHGRRYFNSVVSLDGSLRYDKQHLVPFSEFYPGFSLLAAIARWIGMPMAQFSVGKQSPLQPLLDKTVGVAICYEADFAHELAKVSALTDWWLVVSDDGWFYPSHMAAQHWQMTRMRARELGREVVRVTNQGYTGVVDVDGHAQVVAQPSDPLQAHLLTVHTYRGQTPFVRYGERPLWVLFMGVLLWLSVCRWRQVKR